MTPQVAPSPAAFRITVTLARLRPDDRVLAVELDGEDYFRASAYELDPVRPRSQQVLLWRDIIGHGHGVLTASLGDGRGHWRASASTEVVLE